VGEITAHFLRFFLISDVSNNYNETGFVPHFHDIGRKRNVTDFSCLRADLAVEIANRFALAKTNHLLHVAAF
jgi:hypothetical protein